MSTKIPVLGLGIPLSHPSIATHPSLPDPTTIGVKLAAAKAGLEASRFEVVMMCIDPDKEGWKGEVEEMIRSLAWKAIVVPWVVRGHPGLTPFFEQLLTLAHASAPPDVKFCFNTSPATILESLERNLGEA